MADHCGAASTEAEIEKSTQRLTMLQANHTRSRNLTNAVNLSPVHTLVQLHNLVRSISSSKLSHDPAFRAPVLLSQSQSSFDIPARQAMS